MRRLPCKKFADVSKVDFGLSQLVPSIIAISNGVALWQPKSQPFLLKALALRLGAQMQRFAKKANLVAWREML
jgi:hypothetical protein